MLRGSDMLVETATMCHYEVMLLSKKEKDRGCKWAACPGSSSYLPALCGGGGGGRFRYVG
jgi:hypothetical protein